jgi:multiple sugar transport system permease protein
MSSQTLVHRPPRNGNGSVWASAVALRRLAQQVLLWAGLLVLSAVMLAPLVWMIGGAMKSNGEVMAIPIQWLPSEIRLAQNYRDMMGRIPYTRYYLNSVIVAVFATAGSVFFSALIGYGLAKFEFPGKRYFFGFIMATMMVPSQLTLIGLYVVVKNLGWLNTYHGLIVPEMLTAFGIFLMRQSMLVIPDELIDAARIDGSGEFRIFTAIVLPLVKPALATLAILAGTAHWDSFLWPLIVISDKRLYTLPVGLRFFLSDYGSYYNELMLGSLLALLPVLAMFLIFQRQFIRGVINSGLKQ